MKKVNKFGLRLSKERSVKKYLIYIFNAILDLSIQNQHEKSLENKKSKK